MFFVCLKCIYVYIFFILCLCVSFCFFFVCFCVSLFLCLFSVYVFVYNYFPRKEGCLSMNMFLYNHYNIYIYILYIYIYTSRYSYIHLHGSLDPCRLYQHVLPEYLRSPALTGPCQALLQKLLFLGCGIGDGVSWVSIALSNIRQGEQYSIGLFGQVTVKSGMFVGLAIGGSEPCAVILFFSSYTRYTFLFT